MGPVLAIGFTVLYLCGFFALLWGLRRMRKRNQQGETIPRARLIVAVFTVYSTVGAGLLFSMSSSSARPNVIDTLRSYGLGSAVVALTFGLIIRQFVWTARLIVKAARFQRRLGWLAHLSVTATMTLLTICFSYIYWAQSYGAGTCMNKPMGKLDATYFTVATLLQTSFSDISAATDVCKALAGMELVIGYLLTFVFVGIYVAVVGGRLLEPE
jgi:hypothetical protein